MAIKVEGKNAMLAEFGSKAAYVSLHSGFPATSGNEISGGTPAYARKAITWSAAAGGQLESSNAPTFDVPGAKTVQAIGFWSAATSGTLYADASVTNETYGAQGTYTLSSATITLSDPA